MVDESKNSLRKMQTHTDKNKLDDLQKPQLNKTMGVKTMRTQSIDKDGDMIKGIANLQK